MRNSRHPRKNRLNRNFRLQQLEGRDLMAGDIKGPPPPPASAPAPAAEVRSYDGTGNNKANPEWGSTFEQFSRVATAAYGDGISTPAGSDRPSARAVSNALVAQADDEANNRQMTAYAYLWGQFIDHDIDLTASATANKESMPIAVPTGDAYFDPTGTGTKTIGLTRSAYDPATGTTTPRQQINDITSWIDGSMVYGSDAATATSLRTLSGGKMKTSAGNLLPTDAGGFFQAGDIRVNENVELIGLQTLFVREHNFQADKIAKANPKLTDEQIFQQARAIVIAEIQAITFNEFLPALLGLNALGPYRGYNASVSPAVTNEFATAGFRLGHSLVNDDVEFFGNDGRAVRDEVELAEAFFNPALVKEAGIDSMLKYTGSTLAQEIDPQIVDSLRNFLFGPPGAGGFDLAALNIQRGRDHGLADYNTTRAAYGLPKVTSFAQITKDVDVQAALASTYGSVDNIDLWVGALAEDHVPGASVGQLTQRIVAEQFERLRAGDRLWYQNTFTGAMKTQLEQTHLSDVIKRNTTVNNLQANVFFLRSEVSGQVTIDANKNGRFDPREAGLAGMSVELLNDEGEVVARTKTDPNGMYRFNQFGETGDYTVRIVLGTNQSATSAITKDVLVSRGDLALGGVNFSIAPPTSSGGTGGTSGGNTNPPKPPAPPKKDAPPPPSAIQTAAGNLMDPALQKKK